MSTGYHFVNYTSSEVADSSENPYTFTYTVDNDATITSNIAPNTYTIYYDANGGVGDIDETAAIYDTSVTLNSDEPFSKVGYLFAGWAAENGDAIPGLTEDEGVWTALNLTSEDNGSVTVYAQWTPITYTVTIDEQNGTPELSDLTGVTYDTAREIVGGETLARQGYTLAGYGLDGNELAGFTEISTEDLPTSEEISDAENLTNYLRTQSGATGIYRYNGKFYVFNLTATNTDSVGIFAVWTAATSNYTVEYYLETLAGGYELDTTTEGTDFAEIGIQGHSSTTMSGTTGTEVSIAEQTYEGFTFNAVDERNVLSGTITGDNQTLILRRYYTRNTYTVQVITPNLAISGEDGTFTGVDGITGSMLDGSLISYKYNQEVTINATIRPGYTFNNYSEQVNDEQQSVSTSNPYTFKIRGNRVLTINITREQFTLTINHEFETLTNGQYETLAGQDADVVESTFYVDHIVTAEDIASYVKNVTGYVFEGNYVWQEDGTVITFDNLAVVTIRYERDTFTLTLQQNNTGVESVTASNEVEGLVVRNEEASNENQFVYDVIYGAEVTISYTLATGYTFAGWKVTPESITVSTVGTPSGLTGSGIISAMPTEAVNVTVLADAGRVPFKIEYHLQQLDGTYSHTDTQYDDSTQTWYVDRTIPDITDGFTLATISGYEYSSFKGSTVIRAPKYEEDGSVIESTLTTLVVYYDRADITINVALGEGVTSVTLTTSGYSVDEFNKTQTFRQNGTFQIVYDARVNLTQEIQEGYNFNETNYTLTVGQIEGNITDGIYFNVPSSETTLTARASSNSFNITFNNNGGEGTIAQIEEVEFNREITLTLNNNQITRVGYTFNGWNTDPNGEGDHYADGATFVYSYTHGITLYAQWTPNTYNLTYNGNEGTGVVDAGSPSATFGHTTALTYDTAVELRSDIVWSRDGYTVNGWSLTQSNVNNVQLISEDLSSQEGETAAEKVTNYLRSLGNATGIYEYNDVYYAFNLVPSGTTTIYVAWEENEYSIVYHSNYGEGKEDKITVSNILYTQEVTILARADETFTFAKTGYTFTGWNTLANGQGSAVQAGSQQHSLTGVPNGTYELYAQWTPNTYTITFDGNAEDVGGSTAQVTATYDTATELTANGFTRNAYDFAGWTLTEDGTTSDAILIEDIGESESLTAFLNENNRESGIYLYNGTYYAYNLVSDANGSDILYAVWSAHTYTITYSAGEGALTSSATDTYTILDEVTLYNNNDMNREGHRLVGFTISATGNSVNNWTTTYPQGITLTFGEDDTIGSFVTEAGLYGDITLTARWEALTYNVIVNYIFDTDCAEGVAGGEASEQVTRPTVYDNSFEIISPTNVTGYTATRVKVTSPNDFTLTSGSEASVIRGTMPASDVVITVYYSPNVYTLTINYNVVGTGDVQELSYTELKVKYGFTYKDAYYVDAEELKHTVGLETLTREGYRFTNWALDAGGVNTISNETVVNITSDRTIYAVWSANPDTDFTVQYYFENLEDKEYTLDSRYTQTGEGTTDADITLDMIKALTKEGLDDSTTALPVVTGFSVDEQDIVLGTINADGQKVISVYYTRDYNTLTITRDTHVSDITVEVLADDSVVEDDSLYISSTAEGIYSVRYGTTLRITASFRSGYEFDNFELVQGTISGFTSTNPLEITMPDENVEIEANSKASEFTINYYANDGVNGTPTVRTGTFNSPVDILGNDTFTRTGYEFVRWNTDPNGEGTPFEAGSSYTMTTYQAVLNLYAQWDANPYNFTLNADRGIDLSQVSVEVDGEVQSTLPSTIDYDQTVTIKVPVGAIVMGYNFGSISYTMDITGQDGQTSTGSNETAPVEGTDTEIEIKVTGALNVTISTTPRADSQIKIVYALREVDLTVGEGEQTSDTYAMTEEIVNGAETYHLIDYSYIASLRGADGQSALKTFTGFFFANIDDDINSAVPNDNFRVIYNTDIAGSDDDSTYTTVYVLYERYYYGLKLNSISVGASRFEAEGVVDGSVVYYNQGGYDEYRVKYGATVNIYLNILTGYDFNRFNITAVETTGLEEADDETSVSTRHTLSFEQTADAEVGVGTYYYMNGEERVDVLSITHSGDNYVISTMPNYYLDVTADVTPKEYEVTYHKNWDDNATSDPETATFDASFTFKGIENFAGWARDGYEFLGWAASEEAASTGNVLINVASFDETSHEFTTTFNNTYAQSANEDQELHLYAVWTRGTSTYTIEYYFEELNGSYTKDDYERVLTGATDLTASTNGLEGVQIDGEDEGVRVGFEVYREHENAQMSGIVTSDGSLVLRVYYRLIQYTLTLNSDGRFDEFNVTSTDYTLPEPTITTDNGEADGVLESLSVQVKFGANVTISATPSTGYKLSAYNVTIGGVQVSVENPTFAMPNNNVTISVVSSPRTFNLTFNSNGGSGEMAPQEFEFGVPESINANTFSRQGYSFGGWLISGEPYADRAEFTFTVANDLEAVAQWTPATANYTVNFVIQGTTLNEEGNAVENFTTSVVSTGTTESTITTDMVNGLFIQALGQLGEQGHVYTAGEENFFTLTGFEENTVIAGDGTAQVTAVYNRNLFDYTIGINAESVDGITGMTASYLDLSTLQTVTTDVGTSLTFQVAYGVDVTLTPTYANGYSYGNLVRYIGEDLDQLDGTFNASESDGSITFNNGMNKSARYEISASTIGLTFYYNENFAGGINGAGASDLRRTVRVQYLAPITLEQVWTHAGYTFLGWSEDESMTAEDFDAEQPGNYLPTETIPTYTYDEWNKKELYGVWEANSYTIQYVPSSEDVTGEMENGTATYDQVVQIAESTFDRPGYTFNGWAYAIPESGEGTNVATKVDSVENITSDGLYYIETSDGDVVTRTYYGLNLTNVDRIDNNELVILYPVWRALTYNIVLHFDEEDTHSPIEMTATYGQEVTLPLFNTASGGTFEGWTRTGYDFYGWRYTDNDGGTQYAYPESDDPTTETFSFLNLRDAEGETVDFYVNWTEGEATYSAYIVQQDTSGEYTQRTLYSSSLVAMTGSHITPYEVFAEYIEDSESEWANVEGFTVQSIGHNAESVLVQATGTVVEIYYTRNYYRLYLENGAGIESSSIVMQGAHHEAVDENEDEVIDYYNIYFGASVTINAPTLLPGYITPIIYSTSDVELQNENQIASMPSKNVVVSISATPNPNTEYLVNIYLADVEGSYGEEATKTLTMYGTTDSAISIASLRAEVFEQVGEELNLSFYTFASSTGDTSIKGYEPAVPDVSEARGEQSVVNLYYSRNQYNVSYSVTDSTGVYEYPTDAYYSYNFDAEVTATFTLNEGYILSSDNLTITIASQDEQNGTPFELDYDITEGQLVDVGEGRMLMQYTITFTMPTQNINIQINVEADEVEYNVVYRYQDVKLTQDGQIIYDEELQQIVPDSALTNTEITREMLGFTYDDELDRWTIESALDGFTYSSSSFDSNQIYVKGDGSTVIYINFVRDLYQLHLTITDPYIGISGTPTVTIEGVVTSPSISTNTWSVAYGQEVEVTFSMKDGYEFDDFVVTGTTDYQSDNLTLTMTIQEQNVDVGITITPSSAMFTVRYFLQNVDVEDFDAQLAENYTQLNWNVQIASVTNQRYERSDVQTNFITNISSIDGYENIAEQLIGFNMEDWWFNSSYQVLSDRIEGGINNGFSVAANGSTYLDIYINRQVVNVSIELDNTNRVDNDSVEGRDDYLYGDVVTVKFSTNPGYLFDYLRINETTEIREGDANLNVVYDEMTNTETATYEFTIVEDIIGEDGSIKIEVFSAVGTADYTISIYKQVIVQNIGQPEVEIVYGEPEVIVIEDAETDSEIDYSEYTVADPGYYYASYSTVADDTVNGDGSSIVQIYFMLQTYTFSVNLTDGIERVGVYSNYNSIATIESGSSVQRYTVYYTDLIGFEITTVYGYSFNGIEVRVGDGEFVLQDNSTSPDFRLPVPTDNFEVNIRSSEVAVMVNYYPNFEPNQAESELRQFGSTFFLRENTFERPGYIFLGWATSAENANNGIVEYENGAEFTITTTDNVNLYAVWEAEASMPWWIWLVIGLGILLLIIIIIIIIIAVKKKKEKDKIRSR